MEAPRLKRQDAVMNLMKTISTNETSDARFHQRGLGRAEAMALSRNGGWFSKEKEKKAEKSHKNVINAQNFIKAPAHDMAESIFAKYRTQIESLQEQERKVSSPDTARAARPSDLVRIEVLKSLLEKGYLEVVTNTHRQTDRQAHTKTSAHTHTLHASVQTGTCLETSPKILMTHTHERKISSTYKRIHALKPHQRYS